MKKLKSHKCFNGFTEFFEHHSESTQTKMKFSIYRPENSEDIKGGLIWLSGLTCNEENFITKAGAQRVLSQLGLVVVCPDTSPRGLDLPEEHDNYDFGSGAGFYVDATTSGYKEHYRMYSYVKDELYALVQQNFTGNKRIGVFGHSMGGHGALVLGLRNPDKFASVSAFSPIVNPVESFWGKKAFSGYLGIAPSDWLKYDACELVRQGHKHPNPLLIDQGLADEFYPHLLLTENFVEVCKSNNQPSTVNFREGYDHSYYFISTFIEEHLRFHSKYLI